MYGIIISLAILLSTLTAERIIDEDKSKFLWKYIGLIILGGIVGARIYHVLSYLNYYSAYPKEIFNITNGGLAFFGALIGGIITAAAIIIITKQSLFYWLNISACVLPLGQAIGRLANWWNNELYGLPTKLPWGIYIGTDKRPSEFIMFNRFHPLFMYEAVLNLILFYIINVQKDKKENAIFVYLTGYGLIRFFLEFLRISKDTWHIGTFNVAQAICIIMIITGLVGIIKNART